MGKSNTREIALIILKQINYDGKYSNIALKNELKRHRLDARDIAFITQLVYGTLERQITIDWVLSNFTNVKKNNPWLVNILRMGCYQILYLDKVPHSAACNEAVELTKKYISKSLTGYVNGVLRNIARNHKNIAIPSFEEAPATHLMIKYSCPKWLCDMWLNQYGVDNMKNILDSSYLEGMTTLRTNSIKTHKTKLIQELKKLGYDDLEEGLYINSALRIKNIRNIEDSPLYRQGYYAVQGESSMICTHVVDVAPGDRILDACSAPGGKACYMGELMDNVGEIDAWDIHPHRVDLIGKNASRLGVSIINAVPNNAAVYSDDYNELYDKILLDVPCSGLGIMHKKPDIKLKITEKGIENIIAVQKRILKTCSRYVKPGGILVYSTCTINKNENEDIIHDFLESNVGFELDDIYPFVPKTLENYVQSGSMIQLFPGRDGIDGFFIARLRRKVL